MTPLDLSSTKEFESTNQFCLFAQNVNIGNRCKQSTALLEGRALIRGLRLVQSTIPIVMKLVRPPRHKLDPPSANEISADNLNAEQFILLEKPNKEQLHQLLPPRRRIYRILAKIALVLILAISYLTFCFIDHYRTILIGRSGVLGPPFGHCEHTFIIPDCPAFSSSQHRINYHNCGYFDCLCRAVAFERRRKRDQGRFGCLSSVHTALNSRSGLVG